MKRILNKIAKSLSSIEDVKAVVLYGSFARREYSSRSDIDLLILTTEKKTIKKVQDKVIALEQETGRNIQPTIRTLEELQKTDTGLLQNIFHEGKLLYLREAADIPSAVLLEQKPFLVYTFQLTSLNQKEKARFNRQLYEVTRKGYKYKRLLQKLGGQKLSAGCILVPHSGKQAIEKFFKKFKVQFSQLKVWK
jgi:predicted nucleotidyltransferase